MRSANPQIDWRKLIGFRNLMAHNTDLLVLRTRWETVEQLPALRGSVEAPLAGLPPDEDTDEPTPLLFRLNPAGLTFVEIRADTAQHVLT